MKKSMLLTCAALLQACHPSKASDAEHQKAMKAQTDERAKRSAQQDAIQARRQLDLVAARNANAAKHVAAGKAPEPLIPQKD